VKESIDISIVIVNYNVKDLVLACLKSIYAFTNPALRLEIFVVDNDSKDGSKTAIPEAFPHIHFLDNHFNAGFPAANNQAFKLAQGRYIFMLNPDTEVKDDSIGKLYQYLETHAQVAMCSPKLLNSDLSFQQSVWRFPTLTSIFLEMHYLHALNGKKDYRDQNFQESFSAESVSGAAIFFRRELLESVGYLDEKMFWIEDIDFCYRAVKAGNTLMYLPEATVVHHIGQSAKKNYNISISNQIWNKIKFFRKHYSTGATFLVKCMSAYHVVIKFVMFSLMSPFSVIYQRKASAYVYTFKRVFNPPDGIQ